jgi:hypothetical protein
MADSIPSAPEASSGSVVQPIPFRSDSGVQGGGVGLPAAALACVVVLAAAIFVLKRLGASAPSLRSNGRLLQVLESTRIADRTRVSVVRYRDREIVVAHSDHAIAVLADEPIVAPGDAR